ncbi:MAG: DUF5305 family protein [Mycobacterium leprae]
MKWRQKGLRLVGLCTLFATGAFAMAGLRAAQAPAYRVVEQTVPETVLTAEAGLTYDVEMTAPTSVWPAGARLEPDRALYTYAGDPVLHLRPILSLSGPRPGTVTGLSLLAVDLSGFNLLNLPIWQKPALPPQNWEVSEPLPGDSTPVRLEGPEVAIRMAEVRAKARQIRDDLGFIQSTEGMVITFTATVKATVDQRDYQLPLQVVLPIKLEEDGYAPGPLKKAVQSAEAKGERVETVQVPIGFLSRLSRQIGWLCCGVIWVLVGAVLLYMRKPRKQRTFGPFLSPSHQRFKDWITVGRVTPHDALVVQVLTLDGLVDLAIDMNKRVVLDPDRKQYVVIDEGVFYIFSPLEIDQRRGM